MLNKLFKKGWSVVGRLLYTFLHPFFYWLIKGSTRSRVAIVCGDEVLVVRNWLSNGEYRLPGGGLDKGESWQQSAVREIQEELGLEIDAKNLVHLEDYTARKRGGEYKVVLCKLSVEDKPQLSPHVLEIIAYKWVKLDDPIIKRSVWGKLTKNLSKNSK